MQECSEVAYQREPELLVPNKSFQLRVHPSAEPVYLLSKLGDLMISCPQVHLFPLDLKLFILDLASKQTKFFIFSVDRVQMGEETRIFFSQGAFPVYFKQIGCKVCLNMRGRIFEQVWVSGIKVIDPSSP